MSEVFRTHKKTVGGTYINQKRLSNVANHVINYV